MKSGAIDLCLFLKQTLFTSNVLLAHCTSFKLATKHQNYFGDIWSIESKQDNSLAERCQKENLVFEKSQILWQLANLIYNLPFASNLPPL